MLLTEALTPASREDCAHWIDRFLCHFPKREVGRDGVVISDLIHEFCRINLPLVAIIETLSALWKEASADNPWVPPSGEILRLARTKANTYASILQRDKAKLLPPA